MCLDWAFGIRNETTKFISTIPPPAENAHLAVFFLLLRFRALVSGGRERRRSPEAEEEEEEEKGFLASWQSMQIALHVGCSVFLLLGNAFPNVSAGSGRNRPWARETSRTT